MNKLKMNLVIRNFHRKFFIPVAFLSGIFWGGLSFCVDPGLEISGRNRILVLTTDPTGDSFANGKRIENVITSLIDNAQRSVYLAIYNFDSRPVLESLLGAKKRGVVVEVVGDYHELETPGYLAMNEGGIKLVGGNLNAIQHNKFIIIDDKILITGTGNISHSDFYHNDNHFLVIRDEALAGIYKNEFLQMFNGFFSTLKSSFKMSPATPRPNPGIDVFFSPQESRPGTRHMIEKINSATNSIYYMIYAFSHDEIATALIKAARRGVRVYGIHDSSFIKGTSQEAPRLYMSGFKNASEQYETGPFVRADGNTNTFFINGIEHGGKMHCKTMIIDPETDHGVVLTGSFNWSNNAVENNDENLLSIANPFVVRTIKRQWDKAWKISRPLEYAFANLSGSFANLNDIYISEINWAGTSNGASLLQNDDYVEIYNNSPVPVDITHWTITWSNPGSSGQNDNSYSSYSFPDLNDGTPSNGAVILPGRYGIIYGNSSGIISTAAGYLQNGIKIPDSKEFSLPDAGISITLYDRNMNLIDKGDLPVILREGYFDPTLKRVASMNRRVKAGGRPDNGWYSSKVECLWTVCQTSFLYGSPGYQNEPAGPIAFKTVEINNDQSFTVTFSGSVNHCTNPGDYSLYDSSGTMPIENISIQNSENKLNLKMIAANNAGQTYGLKSRAFAEFEANTVLNTGQNLFMGTNYGLAISTDNGVTFQNLQLDGLEKQKVRKIIYDAGTLHMYVATNHGLFTTSDNGLTFQKIQVNITPLAEIIYDVRFNSNYLAVATGDGLYLGDKLLLNFQKISNAVVFSLYLSDSLLLAGGNGIIYNFQAPFTTAPTAIPIGGIIHDIKFIGLNFFAGTTSGLYSSNDGLNFTPAYASIFSGKVINSIDHDDMNNPLILSHDQISGIYPSGIQTFDLLQTLKPANVNAILFNGTTSFSTFLAAGDFGLLTGNSLDLLDAQNVSNLYTCSPEQSLPSGSVVFNGYGAVADREPAKLILNEISLVNADSHDWIELYVTASGSLKNMDIDYYDARDQDILYSFPDMHVFAGDIILVYLQSAYDQKTTLSGDVTFVKSTPYKFYSTHYNLNRGDGILAINQNNHIMDALYYSNRDGYVNADFMQGGLQKAYFDFSLQSYLTTPLPFPVQGWNDLTVQNSGVKIPNSGFSRTIVRISKSPNTWAEQPVPTPGL